MKTCQLFDYLEDKRTRYIERVNKILNSHKGPTIDSFRVEFDLQLSDESDIDSWINFALQTRVRRLELDLERVSRHWKDLYAFSITGTKNCYPFPEESLGNSNIKCLTSLNLNFVNLRGEVLKYLLSNCPFLEFVRILRLPGLVGGRVLGLCPKLKYLEITHCHNLKYLDICASNLTSLTYFGTNRARLHFSNVPNLTDVALGGSYCANIVRNFSLLPIALSQIENLKLSLCTQRCPYFKKIPTSKNVKQLELKLIACDEHSLLSCAAMIKACPLLYKFSLEFDWLSKPEYQELRDQMYWEHRCLKLVELRWFCGSTTDFCYLSVPECSVYREENY